MQPFPFNAELSAFAGDPYAPPLCIELEDGAAIYRLDFAELARAEAQRFRRPAAAMQLASYLRALANDLDAMAYAWDEVARASREGRKHD